MTVNRLPVDSPGLEGEWRRVEVRRSARRKKTISAAVVGEALVVSIPERLSQAEEHEWVRRMAERVGERRRRDRLNSDGALAGRARDLAARYVPGADPASVEWVSNQSARWGSCSPEDGTIRISTAIAEFPAWVRDYVIVHELAHLLVADHSPRFWDIVGRYPLAERARGFLIAKGMDEASL